MILTNEADTTRPGDKKMSDMMDRRLELSCRARKAVENHCMSPMPSPLDNICCARLPRAALPLLASLRTEPGVQAALTEEYAWIRWEAGNEQVLQTVMPIHDAILF